MAHKFMTTEWVAQSSKVPKDIRITFGQYKVLSLVSSGCDSMNQIINPEIRPDTAVDRLWVADRSVTSARIADLVQRGMLTCINRESDKRTYALSITEKGQKALERGRVIDAKVEASARSRLTLASMKDTIESLRKLAMENLSGRQSKNN